MKNKLVVLTAVSVLLAAMLVSLSACDTSLLRPSDDDGEDSGLVVGIRRLDLDRPLVAATAAVGEMRLKLDRFPDFNTMEIEDVIWEAWDEWAGGSVVEVKRLMCDQTGNEYGIVSITPEAKAYLADAPLPLEATVRARYRLDHSIYAMATVMALPDWPTARTQYFNFDGGATYGEADVPDRLRTLGFDELDSGDFHLGNGIFLLLGTGNVAADPQRESGNFHVQRPFEIDPEEPFGVEPLGTPRTIGSMQGGHIRTAGDGMRLLRIMGLQRPFEIEFHYQSNAADARWADIRFGDTSGIRVEGPMSASADQARIIRFRWDYDAYYTDHYFESPWGAHLNYWYQQRHFVLDDDGNRIPRDDFVPFLFVEVVRGLQVTHVEIITPDHARWTPEWVSPHVIPPQ